MQTSGFVGAIKGLKGTPCRLERPDHCLRQPSPGVRALLDSSRSARLANKDRTLSSPAPAAPALRPAGRKCMTPVRSRRAIKMAALKRETLIGQALMLYTALVSASTPVALRYLYLTPHPPASAVLASIQLAFAAAILGVITGGKLLWTGRKKERSSQQGDAEQAMDADGQPYEWRKQEYDQVRRARGAPSGDADRQSRDLLLERRASTFSLESVSSFDLDISRGIEGFRAGGAAARLRSILEGARRPLAAQLNAKYRSMWWSGGELGLIAFAANAVMIYGLSLTTIAKGAFLIRASIIFTPLLCTIAGEAVPAGLWAGAVLGFAGSVMISFDSPQGGSSAAGAPAGAGLWGIPPEALGDLILVASAGLWSLVMIRQSRHAPAFPAFDLGTIKVVAMAVLSAGWLAAAALQKERTGQAASSLWEGYHDPLAWLVLLWPALGQYSSGEITAVAAQSRISAAAGQVILAVDPVFSIAMGYLVNRDETRLGALGWAGGTTLMGACILASVYARKEN